MQEDSVMAAAAQFKPVSRVPMIVAALAGFVLGALIGALITAASVGGSEAKGKPGKRGKSKQPAAAAVSSASASAPGDAGAAPAPKPAKPTALAQRVASGDADAIKQLEARAPQARTLEEAVALARGRTQLKRKEIAELTRKVALVPKLVKEDKDASSRFKELANDREVSIDMLHAIAAMPAPTGPDLLYGLIASTWKETETTRLADELLYSKEVRAKASPALSALLDLRKVEKCEEAMKVLERIKKDGDRRAFTPLMRLHNKRGCGEKKTTDCFPCLRQGDLLKEATMEAQKRSGP
jgi:hypothetical protein